MSIFGKPKTRNNPTRNIGQEITKPSVSKYTVISEGAVVQGDVSSEDQLLINGRIEGKVNVKNTVIIGKTGLINADVHASALEIHGKIIGDVTATDRVSIESTGSVEGNIRSPKLMISEGAHFRGNIDMSLAKDKETGAALTHSKSLLEGQSKRFDLRKDIGLQSAVPSDV